MFKKFFYFIFKDLWFYLEINLFVVFAVSLISAALFCQLVFTNSANKAIQVGFSLLNADYLLVPKGKEKSINKTIITGKPVRFYFSQEALVKVKNFEGVEKVSPLLILESVPASCCTAGNVLLVGIDPKSDFSLTPWVRKALGEEIEKDEIIVGNNIKRPLGLNLRFYGHRFKVKGYLEPLGLGFYDNGVFMRLDDAYQMAEETKFKKFTRRLKIKRGEISAILIQQKPEFSREEVIRNIKNKLSEFDLVELDPIAASARKKISKISLLLTYYIALLFMVLIIVLGLVFYLQMRKRERTIGLLEAIGASRKLVYLLVLSEAGLLGLIGSLLGIAIGWLLISSFYLYINHQLQIPFVLPDFFTFFRGGLLVVLVFLAVSLLGSSYSLIYLAAQDPYQIIREGKNG